MEQGNNYITPLKNDPKKWVKHLVLVNCGLREKRHLLNTINRYKIKDYLKCLKSIEKHFLSSPNKYVYIVKLVYKSKFYKLPNIIIRSLKDIEDVKCKLEKMDLSCFVELWYCYNLVKKQEMVFGRLLMNSGPLFPSFSPIYIELVWDNSARSIEKFPNMQCPFIAISKDNWNSDIEFTKIVSNGEDINLLKKYAKRILCAIFSYTSRIKQFGEFIFSFGCSHLSIEFNYVNGSLNFIDWDSDNDAKVLNFLQ